MVKRWSLLAALTWMTFAHGSAWAGGQPRTHDGFFLRLSVGGGTADTKVEDSTGKVKLSGGPGDWNIAIGGVVAPNLAVHGTLWGWSLNDPNLEVTFPGFGSGSGTFGGDVTMSAFGAGATYYAMPVNIYFSGSAGIGKLNVDSNVGGQGSSDYGPVLDVTVGKEWWVGNSWGLGVAGGFSYHSLPDPDVNENWTGTSFTVRFTATLN